jgi:hypothetical protein
MRHDPIVDEVREIRDTIAREHDYDLGSIFRMLRARGAEGGPPHVELAPRRLEPNLGRCGAAIQPGDAATGGIRRS